MKEVLKIIVKFVSVIISLLILIRLLSLLGVIGWWFSVVLYPFRSIIDIGWHIPGWILGFVGCGLNICIYNKICSSRRELILFRISTFFCMFVALLDLFILGIISQI